MLLIPPIWYLSHVLFLSILCLWFVNSFQFIKYLSKLITQKKIFKQNNNRNIYIYCQMQMQAQALQLGSYSFSDQNN